MTSLPASVLQHLALSVPDPERSAAYYAAALAPLGAVSRTALYTSDRGERPMVVEVEHSLSLMLHPAEEPAEPGNPYRAGSVHHFGIHVANTRLVDQIAAAARAAGGRLTDGPRTFAEEYRFGYYGAFLRDPDEVKWEAFCYTEFAREAAR